MNYEMTIAWLKVIDQDQTDSDGLYIGNISEADRDVLLGRDLIEYGTFTREYFVLTDFGVHVLNAAYASQKTNN